MSEILKNTECLYCEQCYKNNSLFNLLSESDLEVFNDKRVSVSFKKGEIIYKQGMPLTHIVIIHNGFGKIFIEGTKEKNLILRYTKAYDLNGGIGIFIDQLHHSSMMAANNCETCLIDIESFNKVMLGNQLFMEAYLKEYSKGVDQTYHRFSLLTQKNMEARMAETILYLYEHIFNNGSIQDVSKLDLAEYTAMSKESAIRVLKEFKDEKYIEIEDQKITLIDNQTLRKIALYG